MTSNLRSCRPRPLTFAEIQSEIDQDAPIGTRVGWFGGKSGHFQTIVGWLMGVNGTAYIDVSDPIYLNTQIALSDFATMYQSGGTWRHSYLTKPSAGAMTVALGGALYGLLDVQDPHEIGA